MKINEVKEFISNLSDKEIHTPLLLIGPTGIGKSWITKELATNKNLQYVDLRLATQEVTDLIGIPRTIKDEDDEPRTVWTKPCWFPKEGTKGILALEEVNRAPEDVRQAIFQLLTEWQLHTHKIPKGWIIVALINPDNGQYHVNRLDPAFRRRFIQVIVNPPDVIDWSIWAKQNGVKDDVIRFVSQFPKLLNKSEDINIEAVATPAGYHMLSTLLNSQVVPNNCLHEIASGIVGIEAATTFVQSLKRDFEKPITAEQIFKDYKKVQDRYKKMIKEKRNDLIYVTMIDIIADCETKKLDKDAVNNMKGYLSDCLPETLTTIVLRLNDSILGKLSKYEELVDKIIDIKKSISNV